MNNEERVTMLREAPIPQLLLKMGLPTMMGIAGAAIATAAAQAITTAMYWVYILKIGILPSFPIAIIYRSLTPERSESCSRV